MPPVPLVHHAEALAVKLLAERGLAMAPDPSPAPHSEYRHPIGDVRAVPM